MIKNLLLLAVLCTLAVQQDISAQRSCGSDQHMEELKMDERFLQEYELRQARFRAFSNANNAQRSAACPNPTTLPMAVHYQGLSAGYDEACLRTLALDQIQILNDDYGGTNSDISNWVNNAASFFPGVSNAESCVAFCLATQNHPAGYGLSNDDLAVTFNATSGDNNSDWSGYINIFVRDINFLGYSPLGGSGNGDGVVIDDEAFGSGSGCGPVAPGAPYDLGRTLTHELGHYLNLDHIWGGGCNVDDNVADTPDSQSDYGGCPNLGVSSCGSTDMHMSYMDYTNDACMYMFSAGQGTRMENYTNANLQNVINNYQTACVSAPPTCNDGFQNQGELGVDCGGPCPACPPETCAILDLSAIQSYDVGGNDQGTATLFNSNQGVTITGNGWKAVALNYTITPNTMIEFDFSGGVEGEIHEISFDNDLIVAPDFRVVVWGNQGYAGDYTNGPTYTGSGNVESLAIPIGSQLVGTFQYLVLNADDDATGNGVSIFNNIKIYEDTNGNQMCDAATATCPDDFAGGGMSNSSAPLGVGGTGIYGQLLDQTADFETSGAIISTQILGFNNPNILVDYDASDWITLEPGFEARQGVLFDAFIDTANCNNGAGGNQ